MLCHRKLVPACLFMECLLESALDRIQATYLMLTLMTTDSLFESEMLTALQSQNVEECFYTTCACLYSLCQNLSVFLFSVSFGVALN